MLTLLNDELDYRRLRHVPLVTPLPLSVFAYLQRYPIGFKVGCFGQMCTDGNELQVQDLLGEFCDGCHWMGQTLELLGRSRLSKLSLCLQGEGFAFSMQAEK